METEIQKRIRQTLNLLTDAGLYPTIPVVTGGVSSRPSFLVDGREVLSFCSGNYLGLADSSAIKNAITEGLQQYGVHPSGSPLISGTLEVHRRLEKEIAEFLGMEDAMLFNTSTMANIGAIPPIVDLQGLRFLTPLTRSFLSAKEGALFGDEFNHPTIVDGCRLAKAELVPYKHCDMNDLEKKLEKHEEKKRKVILTDGVFSTSGEIAPLREIVELALKYGAMVYVDDALATGILGENGRGTMEHLGLKAGVDIVVTTFSKAFGVVGGAVAASKAIIDYLRVLARTYMFSGAFLGALALGILRALEMVREEGWRRERLWDNTRYLRDRLREAGFNTLNSETPIIPVLVGDEKTAIRMSEDLFEQGILSPPFRWPAVPKGKAMMRFTVTCEYSKEQLDRLVESLVAVGRKHTATK